MLSSDSIIKKGRYRIVRKIGSIGTSAVYDALDNLHSTNVIIAETPLATTRVLTVAERESQARRFEQNFSLANLISNDRFVRNAEQFVEVDRHYVVTESVGQLTSPITTGRLSADGKTIAAEIDAWLQLAEEIRQRFPIIPSIEITPTSVRIDAKGNPRLLFFGESHKTNSSDTYSEDSSDLAYLPLEAIWPQLDAASQKAISNSYNDYSLERLESPLDFSSDLYSIAAIMFRIGAGQSPPNAIERSIEVLEGSADSLIKSIEKAGFSLELSNFFARAMQLKREDRFESFSEARSVIGSIAPAIQHLSISDDHDLLELPPEPTIPVLRQFSRKSDPIEIVPESAPSPEMTASVVSEQKPSPEIAEVRIQPTIGFEMPARSEIKADILDAPIVYESPVRTVSPPKAPTPSFNVSPIPVRNRSYSALVAGSIAIVVFGGAILGFVMTQRPDATIEPAPQAATITATKAEPAAVQQPMASVEPETSANAATQIPDSKPTSSESPLPNAKPERSAIADVKQPKKASDVTEEKPEPKKKKTVTVDDLISDN